MSESYITSKELMAATGISRATLNNYIAQGVLPSPKVERGAGNDVTARRIGYFPASTQDVIKRVQDLKKQGISMAAIVNLIRSEGDSDVKQENNTPTVKEIPPPSPPPSPPPPPSPRPSSGIMGNVARLTVDHIEGPAYLLNAKFELEWANERAIENLFGPETQFSNDISERKFFSLLADGGNIDGAEGRDELLRFHLEIARKRLSRVDLLHADSGVIDYGIRENMVLMFDEVSASDGGQRSYTEVNLASRGQKENWFSVHASFFREGIFFAYSRINDAEDTLVALLSRRDIVIREILKKRRPYLTDLSVLVADLQNSVKICAELPPEEYFELINDVWSSMEPILRKYFGTHGKHVGDGLVCYFFPQPDSSYLMNALCCAYEMRTKMRQISQHWRKRKNWLNELVLNIGVHEGQEWFGTYQTPTHVEFTVLGDTINMTGRLSDMARDGAVWASKSLIGKLTSKERTSLQYGIRRRGEDDDAILVPETFSRVSGLMDIKNPKYEKFTDISGLVVTEVIDIEMTSYNDD